MQNAHFFESNNNTSTHSSLKLNEPSQHPRKPRNEYRQMQKQKAFIVVLSHYFKSFCKDTDLLLTQSFYPISILWILPKKIRFLFSQIIQTTFPPPPQPPFLRQKHSRRPECGWRPPTAVPSPRLGGRRIRHRRQGIRTAGGNRSTRRWRCR